jgi:pimeloyl-ACP methyl ester carboxylesterase
LILGRRRPWPGKVAKPTLVVWGEQDIFLEKGLNEGLSDWVEDLTLSYLPDSGHWVQQEKPAEVNKNLLAFLGPGEERDRRLDRPV